jgi:hypothetical protein
MPPRTLELTPLHQKPQLVVRSLFQCWRSLRHRNLSVAANSSSSARVGLLGDIKPIKPTTPACVKALSITEQLTDGQIWKQIQ